MLFTKEELFEKLVGDTGERDAEVSSVITRENLATIRSRYKKDRDLSISTGVVCRLAQARGTSPIKALLSFIQLRLGEDGRDSLSDEQLRARIELDLDRCAKSIPDAMPGDRVSLAHFPGGRGFEGPFVVVTGDRRETTGNWMSPADFGAVSSSAAELRFVYELGLPRDTTIVTDKTLILAPFDELQKRFAETNIVCCGSPAANHVSRILNRYAIHRYNLTASDYRLIEDFVEEAWYVGAEQKRPARDKKKKDAAAASAAPGFFVAPESKETFNTDLLKEFLSARQGDIKYIANATFNNGIIDPTYERWIRARNTDRSHDFGVITLTQNPFRPQNDARYPALLLSGFHLPGTMYAMHESIWGDRATSFQRHPYGGVIRADLKQPADKHLGFHERMEYFKLSWDDQKGYTPADLIESLARMRGEEEDAPLSAADLARLSQFVQQLGEPSAVQANRAK